MLETGDASEFEGGNRLRVAERPVAVPISLQEPSEAPDRAKKPKAGWNTDGAQVQTPKPATESTVAAFTTDDASGGRQHRPEDDEDEALVQEVAMPPRVAAQPVVSVRELERNALLALPPAPDPGVDLSVLSAALRPAGLVAETAEETWHPTALFAQLIGVLLAEQEEEEQRREAREAQEAESQRKGANPPAVVVSASLATASAIATV